MFEEKFFKQYANFPGKFQNRLYLEFLADYISFNYSTDINSELVKSINSFGHLTEKSQL